MSSINKTIGLLAAIAPILMAVFLLAGCFRDEYCRDLTCASCERFEDCNCVWDSLNFNCPPGTMHGKYSHDSCACHCDGGWTGALCDERDTTLYISFRFGTDTLNLSGLIRTSYYSYYNFSYGAVKFYQFTGTLPPGSEIDTLTLVYQFFNIRTDSVPVTTPVCDTVPSYCDYLKVLLQSGDTATASSGFVTDFGLVTYGEHYFIPGNFEADLHTSTGQKFYIRDGTFKLLFL